MLLSPAQSPFNNTRRGQQTASGAESRICGTRFCAPLCVRASVRVNECVPACDASVHVHWLSGDSGWQRESRESPHGLWPVQVNVRHCAPAPGNLLRWSSQCSPVLRGKCSYAQWSRRNRAGIRTRTWSVETVGAQGLSTEPQSCCSSLLQQHASNLSPLINIIYWLASSGAASFPILDVKCTY